MRIAIIGSRGYPSTYGGYETLVRHLAEDWAEKGHEVTVFCRWREQRQVKWQHENITCRWTPGVNSKSFSTLSYGATSTIVATLSRFDAALVLNIANGFFLPAFRLSRTPVALNTDGIEWERAKWGFLAKLTFRAGAKLAARYAEVLIADSIAIGDIWSEMFGVESKFIPYGADVLTDSPRGGITSLGLSRGAYALAVARLVPENNVDLFLDALESLGSDMPPAVVVGAANSDSPTQERLRRLAHHGEIQWLGHISDQKLLNELWANAGVYVHGHSVGGTNPALLQALGAGAPTVALDTPFNREVLLDDRRLFGASAGELANLIQKVLGDTEQQLTWSAQGKRLVAKRYVWKDVSESYLAALELALARATSQA